MLTFLKIGALAVTIGGAVIGGTALTGGSMNERIDINAETHSNSVPAVLQPTPYAALECTVESDRVFVPARKEFVTKKVQVCR